MPRIRSIHPGLWTDDAFMEASLAAKLIYIGLWGEARDDGVFDYKPTTLKMRILPATDIDVRAVLDELEALNFFQRFEAEGRPYAVIRNFCKFQSPRRPNWSNVLPVSLYAYAGFDTGEQPGPNGPGHSEPIPDTVGTDPVKVPPGSGNGSTHRRPESAQVPTKSVPVPTTDGVSDAHSEKLNECDALPANVRTTPDIVLPSMESESNKQVSRTRLDGAGAPETAFLKIGLEVLGPHSHDVLRRILALKGSTDRATPVIEKAREARAPWAYVQTVLSDPPYTDAANAPSRRSREIDRMCEEAITGGEKMPADKWLIAGRVAKLTKLYLVRPEPEWIEAMIETLARFPIEVTEAATATDGLAAQCRFLPTIAETITFCRDEARRQAPAEPKVIPGLVRPKPPPEHTPEQAARVEEALRDVRGAINRPVLAPNEILRRSEFIAGDRLDAAGALLWNDAMRDGRSFEEAREIALSGAVRAATGRMTQTGANDLDPPPPPMTPEAQLDAQRDYNATHPVDVGPGLRQVLDRMCTDYASDPGTSD